MSRRQRTTQQSAIARSFGGRSGFTSEELSARDEPAEQMTRWERSAAWLNWRDSHNHYEEYADDNHFGINRLLPSSEIMISVAIVLFVFGSYGAFIAVLALTR
jgi:hypothetical protein